MSVIDGTLDKARREELASFLRSRRARVTPVEVGLAPGPRRRTPGCGARRLLSSPASE